MSQTLPFDSFLEILRAKGYAVTLHEHMALARLLERWDRTDVNELRDAMAALIGRNRDEVEGIERLFDDVYREPPAQPPPPPPPPKPYAFPWGWALGSAAVVVIGGLVVFRLASVTEPPLPPAPPIFIAAGLPPIPPPPDAAPPIDPRAVQCSLCDCRLSRARDRWSPSRYIPPTPIPRMTVSSPRSGPQYYRRTHCRSTW